MQEKIEILGVPFDKVGFLEAAEWLMNLQKRGAKVFTPNPEMILHAQKDGKFLEILRRADLNIPDGIGVLWAARFLGKRILERVTGTDLMQEICRMAAQSEDKVFLLGAGEGVAEQARDVLCERYPGLKICGVFAGTPSEENFSEIKKRICEANPDILFVAYGAPAQEIWIDKYISEFPFVRFAMGVGGAFDFISGKIKRAPIFMRKLGLEWLFRFIKEPSRIKRIFNATVRFPIKVFVEKFWK